MSGPRLPLVAVFFVFSLIFAACGQGSTTVSVSGPETLTRAESGLPTNDPTDLAGTPDADAVLADNGFKLNLGGEDASSSGSTEPVAAPGGAQLMRTVESNLAGILDYDFEIFITMDVNIDGEELRTQPNAPLATGQVRGNASATFMDLSPLLDSVPAAERAALGNDLTMQVVVDPSNNRVHVRAPFFAKVFEPAVANGYAAFEPLLVMKDGWGYVDTSRLGAGDLTEMMGANQGSVDQILQILRAADAEIEELGVEEVNGVQTRHLSSSITLGELLEAQGQQDILASYGRGVGAMVVPYDLWIDGEDRLVAIETSVDLVDIAQRMNQRVGPNDRGQLASRIEITYEAEGPINMPGSSVDMTNAFIEMGNL